MASHKADPAAAQRAAAEGGVAAEALVGIWAQVAESLDVRVSPPQLRALTAVGRYGELNLSQLAEALGALPSSASRLCDRLEAGGLLTRDTGRARRRAVRLRLAPAGAPPFRRPAESRRSAPAGPRAGQPPRGQPAADPGGRGPARAGPDQPSG